MKIRCTLAALACAAVALPNAADAATLNLLTPTVVYDFEGFTGQGFDAAPAAGQLDSDDVVVTGMSDGDVAFGGTGVTGDFARGTDADGGVSAGGVYAFTTLAGLDTLLGVQPGGSDFTPGSFVFKFTNGGTTPITNVTVASTLFVNNDQARGNSFDLYYSTDAVIDNSDTLLNAYTSPEAADGLGFTLQAGAGSGIASGLSIAPGADFYIGYYSDDVSGGGSRDEFGLGTVSVTATFGVVPEPATASLALLALGAIAVRRRVA